MAQCVVCTQLAHVFCLADKCFLCSACDRTIHEANVISRGHKRLPTCALCKRSAASVYCKEDEAALCDVCEREVHSANPMGVMHTVMPIDAAMASGLLGAGEQAAAPAAQPPAPQAPAAAAPAEDAQSSAHISSAPTSLTAELLNSSDASFVVPDMAAPSQPAAQAADAALKGFKDFDALDFEATWFGNLDMGLDFSDILGNVEEELHGMVPTVDAMLSAPAPAAPAAVAKPTVPAPPMPAPFSLEDDFVVPSFLPDDLAEELNSAGLPPAAPLMAPTTTIGVKRSPSFVQLEPPAKVAALAPPAPILAPQPPPLVAPKPEPQAPSRPGPVASGPSLLTMNGANLTREQRVARYREKRKNRKFQKTIRYASRKAYAEVRPRIKGRFATKEEVEAWKAAKAAGLPDPTGISAANPAMA